MKVSRVEYRRKLDTQEMIQELEDEGWELANIAVAGEFGIDEVALHFTKDVTIADLARRK